MWKQKRADMVQAQDDSEDVAKRQKTDRNSDPMIAKRKTVAEAKQCKVDTNPMPETNRHTSMSKDMGDDIGVRSQRPCAGTTKGRMSSGPLNVEDEKEMETVEASTP